MYVYFFRQDDGRLGDYCYNVCLLFQTRQWKAELLLLQYVCLLFQTRQWKAELLMLQYVCLFFQTRQWKAG